MDITDITQQFNFFQRSNTKIEEIKKEYKSPKCTGNKECQKLLEKKNPWLKSGKHPSFYERLALVREEYEVVEIELLKEYYSEKVKGTFKHGQTMKTFLTIKRCINYMQRNILPVIFTKNSLINSNQFLSRLLKQLKTPMFSEKQEIALIQHKKPEWLNDRKYPHIHHFVNFKEYKQEFLDYDISLVLCCSNTTRLNDGFKIIDLYYDSNKKIHPDKAKKVALLIDEAHDSKSGVPPNRDIIDTCIVHPNLHELILVTASPRPLYINGDPIWDRILLEMNAINFTDYDMTQSSSPHYHAVKNSHHIDSEKYLPVSEDEYERTFEPDLMSEFDELNKCFWKEKNPDPVNPELDFCPFIKDENKALYIAKKFLLNNYKKSIKYNSEKDGIIRIWKKKQTIISINEFGIYIIMTPKRNILSFAITQFAIEQSYKPICIGIWKGKKIAWIPDPSDPDSYRIYEVLSKKKELNDIILDFKTQLEREHGEEFTNRPFIIVSNDLNIGESTTLVHCEYGTIRALVYLPYGYHNESKDYQALLRSSYMDTKFKEKNPSFTFPISFIICDKQSHQNAIDYEEENDERVERLQQERKEGKSSLRPEIKDMDKPLETSKKNTAKTLIPIKVIWLNSKSAYFSKFQEIAAKRNTAENRKGLVEIIRQANDEGDLEINDNNSESECNYLFQHGKGPHFVSCYQQGKNDVKNYIFDKLKASFDCNECLTSGKWTNGGKRNVDPVKGDYEIYTSIGTWQKDKVKNFETQFWIVPYG